MATIQSGDILNRTPVPGFGAGGGQLRCQTATVTIPAATATTDVVQMFYLPINSVVSGGYIKSADLDTGTTVTWNVGDAASATRYWSASTVSQAGGVDATMAATGRNFVNTARTLVMMQLQAGPTTTAGDVTLHITYTVEEP